MQSTQYQIDSIELMNSHIIEPSERQMIFVVIDNAWYKVENSYPTDIKIWKHRFDLGTPMITNTQPTSLIVLHSEKRTWIPDDSYRLTLTISLNEYFDSLHVKIYRIILKEGVKSLNASLTTDIVEAELPKADVVNSLPTCGDKLSSTSSESSDGKLPEITVVNETDNI